MDPKLDTFSSEAALPSVSVTGGGSEPGFLLVLLTTAQTFASCWVPTKSLGSLVSQPCSGWPHLCEREPEKHVTSGCRWWWCTESPPDPEPGCPGTRAGARRRAWPQAPLFCPQTTCGWIPARADTYWASRTEFPSSRSHPAGARFWVPPLCIPRSWHCCWRRVAAWRHRAAEKTQTCRVETAKTH